MHSQTQTHYLFIPIYNEVHSLPIIESNIITARYITNQIHFLISDNCSGDGTYEELLALNARYPHLTTIHRNQRNLGFGLNLANVRFLNPACLISILGANDCLCPRGFRHLREAVDRNPHVDLFISNWAYTKTTRKGRRKRIYKGDVRRPFVAYSLEEYFSRMKYVPNGIMQFTARRHVLLKFDTYAKRQFKNPQLGVFIDAFPTNCMAIGNPPLCEVAHIEAGGWRECKDTVVKAHEQIADEILDLLKTALSQGRITRETMQRISDVYCQIPVQALFSSWGLWKAPIHKRRYLTIMAQYFYRCQTFRGRMQMIVLCIKLGAQRIAGLLKGIVTRVALA